MDKPFCPPKPQVYVPKSNEVTAMKFITSSVTELLQWVNKKEVNAVFDGVSITLRTPNGDEKITTGAYIVLENDVFKAYKDFEFVKKYTLKEQIND